ncbi:unnamed protein product [Pleuronectes platessa]|uniref:Uncharacterized protein n=1 Tax=Pleuronectes platessa TaxID=8262 RepID=A0A9N7VZ98_PLEPL|nr:unnamed protein product [Pleuronectes platessa]
MRPREKGKSCDPDDLQTLNPWPESGAPPRELSREARVERHIWTLSPRPLRVLSLRVLAVPPHFNTPERRGGEMRATEDGCNSLCFVMECLWKEGVQSQCGFIHHFLLESDCPALTDREEDSSDRR